MIVVVAWVMRYLLIIYILPRNMRSQLVKNQIIMRTKIVARAMPNNSTELHPNSEYVDPNSLSVWLIRSKAYLPFSKCSLSPSLMPTTSPTMYPPP